MDARYRLDTCDNIKKYCTYRKTNYSLTALKPVHLSPCWLLWPDFRQIEGLQVLAPCKRPTTSDEYKFVPLKFNLKKRPHFCLSAQRRNM